MSRYYFVTTYCFLATSWAQLIAPGPRITLPQPNIDSRAPAYPSTGTVVLTLSPGAKFQGVPGEIVNVDFLLTNYDINRFFAFSVREFSGGSSDQINFPGQGQESFIDAISETKAYVRTNETRPIRISLRVPQSSRIGFKKLITLEVQPYLNTASGEINLNVLYHLAVNVYRLDFCRSGLYSIMQGFNYNPPPSEELR